MLSINKLQGQINISSAEGKITGKVITAVAATTHAVTNTAIQDYHLGYFSGMQCIGDIDGDGLDDYCVATERECYTSRACNTKDGIAYVFFGRTDNSYWNNSDMPVEDKADMVLILNHSGWFGWNVTGIGDVNGDRIVDFAINSPNEGAGRVYIFFGRSRANWKLDISTPVTGQYAFTPPFPANRANMSDAQKFKYKWVDEVSVGDGIADFIFMGRAGKSDKFGRNISEAGDVDGDGVNDIIIGASEWTDNTVLKRGKVYVIRGMKKGPGGNSVDWGTTKSIIIDNSSNTTVPFIGYKSLDASNENPGYEMLGYAVAGVGDMNMDGTDDICFGGDNSDQASGCPALASYTVSGVNYQSIANEVHSYRLGKAYMVFGNKGHFFDSWTTSNNSTANVNVTFISGYTLETPTTGQNLKPFRWSGMMGTIISRGGLLCPDPADATKRLNTMLLSEPAHDHGINNYRNNNYGKAYIFFAKNTWASTYDFGSPGAHSAWNYTSLVNYGDIPSTKISYTASPSNTGFGLRNVGDIDGDGYDDIAISSHYDGNQNQKAVSLVYGGLARTDYLNGGSLIDVQTILTGGTHVLKGNLKYINGETYGTPTNTGLCFASKPGDINGDGIKDLIITDYRKKIGTVADAGTSYIDLQCKKGEDLFGQDNQEDNGKEPNTFTWRVFDSPDIWNRVDLNSNTTPTDVTSSLTTPDFIHANPDPKTATTGDTKNHGLIRIHNRGCSASASGVWKVQLFWTLASTQESWPDKWNAAGANLVTFTNCSTGTATLPKGSLIGSFTLSYSIAAGGTIVIDFPWDPPAPAKYKEISNCTGRLDVCLLARIVKVAATSNTIEDKSITGLTTTEDVGLSTNVKNNNNIFTKNLMVVDLPGNGTVQKIGTIGNSDINNPFAFTIKTNLHFAKDERFKSTSLFNIGTNSYFTVGLPTAVYNDWVTQGSNGTDVEDMFATDTNGLQLIKIKSDNAVLNDIIMLQGASFTAQLNYNIDAEYTIPNNFEFENMIMVKLECDLNDSNYNNSYKLWYISNYNTSWEEIGGMSYHYKIY